jgi:hypothetical protein
MSRQRKWREGLKERGLVEIKIIVPEEWVDFFKRLARRKVDTKK